MCDGLEGRLPLFYRLGEVSVPVARGKGGAGVLLCVPFGRVVLIMLDEGREGTL